MDYPALAQEVYAAFLYDAGRFYGPIARDAPLGAGQILTGVRFASYNPPSGLYHTYEGIVLLLTHECDIDPENIRPFAKDALVCPVLDLRVVAEELAEQTSETQARNFLLHAARDDVSRLAYLPPVPGYIDEGGLLYLNSITHTRVTDIDRSKQGLCSLTAYSLSIVDAKLTNHLLRPKASAIPLERH